MLGEGTWENEVCNPTLDHPDFSGFLHGLASTLRNVYGQFSASYDSESTHKGV